MGAETAKINREIEVFRTFIERSGLPIDPATVEKRFPPEPDLVCFHENDGAIAFELTELCDSSLARSIAMADTTYLRTSDASRAVIAKKLRKSYRTEFPMELLCYTAGRLVTPDSVIISAIRPYAHSLRKRFRRVWFLGGTGVHTI